MAASRAICSVWWPMKLCLARSVACLGSRFRGLCYPLWNLRAAKLRVPVCMCVCSLLFVCVVWPLEAQQRQMPQRPRVGISACVSLHSLLAVGGPARAHRSGDVIFWSFLFPAAAHGTPVVELHFQSFSWPMAFFQEGPRIDHTFCVCVCGVFRAVNS